MKTYSIYEAKAKLSQLIRFVKTSGPVTITERGNPVAQVIPISSAQSGLSHRLAHLIDYGLSQKPSRPLKEIKSLGKKSGALKRFLDSRE